MRALTSALPPCEQIGIVPTPEVRMHTIEARDQFLILATDGVWEFIEADEAVEIVGGIFEKGWSAEAACKHLIARAAVEWMQEEGDYRDDITCIIVYLSCRDEMLSQHWRDYGIDDKAIPDAEMSAPPSPKPPPPPREGPPQRQARPMVTPAFEVPPVGGP